MADDIKPSTPNRTGTLKSTLFPIASNTTSLPRRYWVAAIAVAAATISLASVAGKPVAFMYGLAYGIIFIQCLIVYFLCGRRDIWIGMIGVFVVSYVLMSLTPLFETMAPTFLDPTATKLSRSPDPSSMFLGHFVVAGLLEEIFKALPLFALALVGLLCKWGALPKRLKTISLTEPLDGIALGAASGAAFAIIETMHLYMPNAVARQMAEHKDKALSFLVGYEQVIIRLISEIGGHLAYAGYFGYFIGLAVLRPKLAPVYLAVGLVTAAALHALWNGMSGLSGVQVLVGAVGTVFLVAAILQARRLSPTRGQNFATVTFSAASIAPAPAPAPAPASAPAAAQAPAAPRAAGNMVLKIGPYVCTPAVGVKIEPRMLGAAGAGRGRAPIAEVVGGASQLGLKNLGEKSWRVRAPEGQVVEVRYGQIVPLAKGTVIDFVGIEGIVTTE